MDVLEVYGYFGRFIGFGVFLVILEVRVIFGHFIGLGRILVIL